jgi:hypothetical protein
MKFNDFQIENPEYRDFIFLIYLDLIRIFRLIFHQDIQAHFSSGYSGSFSKLGPSVKPIQVSIK